LVAVPGPAAPGWTYQEIAHELGYANRGAVYNIVAAALDTHTTETVDTLQHLEGARLDALQQALWAKAMEGDLPAVAAIVRIIQTPVPALRAHGADPRIFGYRHHEPSSCHPRKCRSFA
jgi:hypothetical protein